MRFAGEKMGGGFSSLGNQSTVNFGEMTNEGLKGRSNEKLAGIQAESTVNQYGLKSIADIRAAESAAEAEVAVGQAQGQAAMFDGLMNGISGIASAGISNFGGQSAGAASYGGTGSTGINTPGKYGSFDKTLGGLVTPTS